jgi:hypothetical protein
MHLVAAVIGSVVLAGAASVSSQGLADLAKKADDNRKAAKKGTKTYTNADAGNVPAATVLSSSGGSAAPPATGATGATGAAGDQAAAGGGRDEAFYQNRIKELRAQLDRDTVLVSAVQTQINSLTSDFVNRDDPAQRSVIEQDRSRAIAELARLQKQVEADRKAISDFEDEARRANVPPGWLR